MTNEILFKAVESGNAEAVKKSLESTDIDLYTECLVKLFLKSAFKNNVEKVKFFLEKMIENIVGVLTDDTGKSTLEIALEKPDDLLKILRNYGIHENSIRYAYECMKKV